MDQEPSALPSEQQISLQDIRNAMRSQGERNQHIDTQIERELSNLRTEVRVSPRFHPS